MSHHLQCTCAHPLSHFPHLLPFLAVALCPSHISNLNSFFYAALSPCHPPPPCISCHPLPCEDMPREPVESEDDWDGCPAGCLKDGDTDRPCWGPCGSSLGSLLSNQLLIDDVWQKHEKVWRQQAGLLSNMRQQTQTAATCCQLWRRPSLRHYWISVSVVHIVLLTLSVYNDGNIMS